MDRREWPQGRMLPADGGIVAALADCGAGNMWPTGWCFMRKRIFISPSIFNLASHVPEPIVYHRRSAFTTGFCRALATSAQREFGKHLSRVCMCFACFISALTVPEQASPLTQDPKCGLKVLPEIGPAPRGLASHFHAMPSPAVSSLPSERHGLTKP